MVHVETNSGRNTGHGVYGIKADLLSFITSTVVSEMGGADKEVPQAQQNQAAQEQKATHRLKAKVSTLSYSTDLCCRHCGSMWLSWIGS